MVTAQNPETGATGPPAGAQYQRGAGYDKKWQRMAAAGEAVHGEADLVCRYHPGRVLDAGCGTGRVAIELAARGIAVAGVDRDEDMLEAARGKAPEIDWYLANLDSLGGTDLVAAEPFDIVVAAGNVMIFCDPGSHAPVVANCAERLAIGGRFITGFQLKPGGYHPAILDRHAIEAGLTLEHRWSTWNAEQFTQTSSYVVSVHQKP